VSDVCFLIQRSTGLSRDLSKAGKWQEQLIFARSRIEYLNAKTDFILCPGGCFRRHGVQRQSTFMKLASRESWI
jgi:hypothetical protein